MSQSKCSNRNVSIGMFQSEFFNRAEIFNRVPFSATSDWDPLIESGPSTCPDRTVQNYSDLFISPLSFSPRLRKSPPLVAFIRRLRSSPAIWSSLNLFPQDFLTIFVFCRCFNGFPLYNERKPRVWRDVSYAFDLLKRTIHTVGFNDLSMFHEHWCRKAQCGLHIDKTLF